MDANVGDLVVCVKRGRWVVDFGDEAPGPDPVYGEICRVGAVRSAPFHGYFLDGYPHSSYNRCRFRKLNDAPDNAELIALIKRPVRKPVTA